MFDVFDSGFKGRDKEVIFAAAAMSSLVCSIVVAMPRRSVKGASRRVASRSAIVVCAGGNGAYEVVFK